MSTITAEQKLTALKHLAGGKDPDMVATIMKTSRDDIVGFARHHGYPDVDKMAWAADIMEKNLDEEKTSSLPAGTPTTNTSASSAPPAGARMVPSTLPPVRPDEVRILINTAKSHPSKRIQAQGNRVIDAIDKLKDLIAEDQEKNSERRKAEAEKAAARAEVERLEQQLRDAKARLRGTTPAKPITAEEAGEKVKRATAPKGEYPCRNEGCDRVIDTPQGRSLHERLRCEHRVEAAAS